MLDLKFIRDNAEDIKKNITNRYMEADVDKVLSLYRERNAILSELEDLRKARNDNSATMKGKLEDSERNALIDEGKRLKSEIASKESTLEKKEKTLMEEAKTIPNMAHPEAPIGKEDKDNTELRRRGTIPSFDYPPKDHVELGTLLDIVDFDTATKVTGTKFYYLKNQAVFLELALTRFALDILQKEGFTPMITPDLAREDIVEGIGFNPRGAESNIYTLEGTDTCLVGTAEITLGGYYANTIVDKGELPIKMAGLSHCFRREAGAAGQYAKGLYRVHQFTKVEMFVFCLPEESENWHNKLISLEERIFNDLDIPYRVVDTCTGDLGNPAYRKFDIEAWMPGRGDSGEWGEVTSTSNCTAYQARRLGIRYRGDGKKPEYVHMLNGTAIAVSRAIIAILENFQRSDGGVHIPDALVPYTGFSEILPP